MLMYRKVDPDKNRPFPTDAEVPPHVRAQVEKVRRQKGGRKEEEHTALFIFLFSWRMIMHVRYLCVCLCLLCFVNRCKA